MKLCFSLAAQKNEEIRASEHLLVLIMPHTFALWLLNFAGNPPSFKTGKA